MIASWCGARRDRIHAHTSLHMAGVWPTLAIPGAHPLNTSGAPPRRQHEFLQAARPRGAGRVDGRVIVMLMRGVQVCVDGRVIAKLMRGVQVCVDGRVIATLTRGVQVCVDGRVIAMMTRGVQV